MNGATFQGLVTKDDSYRGEVSGTSVRASGIDDAGRDYVTIVIWLGVPTKTAIKKTRAALEAASRRTQKVETFEFADVSSKGPSLIFDAQLSIAHLDQVAAFPDFLGIKLAAGWNLAKAFPDADADEPGYRNGKLIVSHKQVYRDNEFSDRAGREAYMDTHTVYKIPRGRLIAKVADPFVVPRDYLGARWFSVVLSAEAAVPRLRVLLVLGYTAATVNAAAMKAATTAAMDWRIASDSLSTAIFGPILPHPMSGTVVLDLQSGEPQV